jgi:hypothetical protein
LGSTGAGHSLAIVSKPWYWFAFLPDQPADAFATAPAFRADGAQLGFLATWRVGAGRKPVGALGIDARAIDRGGEPAWISLALAPERLRILFDDPAICQAMRVVLAGPAADVMSTLVRDPSTIGGAFTATHASTPDSLADDPFARIFPRTLLRVDGGFVGNMPAPAGPSVQRYAGAPWPWDRF